ncbi:MAG: M67 family metallopeptidase [Rhodospirillales bacterium]
MIVVPPALLDEIERAAAAAYPDESCGLLIGADVPNGDIAVARAVVSPNVSAGDTRDSFEVDPKIRFDTMRALQGTNERIVGHFHSHPDGPAQPSERDRAQAWEPELVWLITAVTETGPAETAAFRLDSGTGHFMAVGLRRHA